MEDIVLDVPVDGSFQLEEQFLNKNLRNAFYLILAPPTCMVQKSYTMAWPNGAWTAIPWDSLIADSEDPSTPMFAHTDTSWDWESGTAESWVDATGTVAASTAFANTGTYSLKWTQGTSTSIASPIIPSVSPGMPMSATAWLYAPVALTAGIQFLFYNSSDVIVGSGFSGPQLALTANTWTQVQVQTDVAPATTDHARTRVFQPTASAGRVLYIDTVVASLFTNSTRVNIGTAGWYELSAVVPVNFTVVPNTLTLAFRVNGDSVNGIYAGDCAECATTTNTKSTSFCTMIQLAAGDYVELVVRHSHTASVTSTAAFNCPRLTVRRVRGA